MTRLPLLIVAFVVAGCANRFETRPYDETIDAKAIEGIIYYEPRLVKLTYSFSVLTDKDGAVRRSASGENCLPLIQREEITTLPNYAKPRVLINKPSNFSTGKLGVTLDKGLLTGVNTENSPPAAAAITAVGTVAAAVLPVWSADMGRENGGTACNAAPILTRITPIDP